MKRLVFDARTVGDHYPGIGRYAYGLWQALGERVGLTLVDPALRNTRFSLQGSLCRAASVRSLVSQFQLPRLLGSTDVYLAPYVLFPYALSCPVIVTLFDATPLYGGQMPAARRLVLRLAHWLAGAVARRVVVLSESAREELAGLGVPRPKMVVCPPGLEPSFRPASASEVSGVREKYGLPADFLLCFGSTRWHKNTAAAIEAAANRPLVIVGEGGPLPFVAEADLPALYSAARTLVFPSLREGFGLPIIEAMACGTPVACLPAPGVREAAGPAAQLAADQTAESLADAVAALDDPVQRAERVQAGLEWARTFQWAPTVRIIESFLE